MNSRGQVLVFRLERQHVAEWGVPVSVRHALPGDWLMHDESPAAAEKSPVSERC